MCKAKTLTSVPEENGDNKYPFGCVFAFCSSLKQSHVRFLHQQVMETKSMLYLVTEFAKNGEIFGKQENIFMFNILMLTSEVCQL